MLLTKLVKRSSVWQSHCAALLDIGVVGLLLWTELLKLRPIRRFWHICQRIPPFFAAVFSSEGLGTHEGRLLIWGKFRRGFISLVPPLAKRLQSRYGLSGGCASCGASCKILFQCPHWDNNSFLCSVYEDRPEICRLFPITPSDVRDRDLVAQMNGVESSCGFEFKSARE